MPDFDIQITGGTQTPWVDLPSEDPPAPARLVPDPLHPPTYRRVSASSTTLVFRAVVNGVVAPLDAALAGRFFTWTWIEWSGTTGPPSIVLTGGQSSRADVTILSSFHAGHFILRCLRAGGGAVLIPFDAEFT